MTIDSIPLFELKNFLTGDAAHTAKWDMSSSYAELWSVADLAAMVPDAWNELSTAPLSYPGLHGGEPLRAAISSYLGNGIKSDQVLPVNGADDALSLLLMASLSAGDKVVLQTPAYPTIATLVKWMGAEVVEWNSDEDNGWAPSLDQLRELCVDGVKLVMLASPHNPSGWRADRKTLQSIAAIATNCGATVICDEVFAGLNHDGSPHESILAADDGVVALGSLSKSFGLPGLRVGWIASKNHIFMSKLRLLRSYMNSYISSPTEQLAIWALQNSQHLLERNRIITVENARLLMDFMARQPNLLSGVLPDSGVLTFLEWIGKGDAETLSAELLKDQGILLVGSQHFGIGPRFIRIGFGKRSFKETLSAFEAAVKAFQ